jgi:hypothetical protein
MPSITDLIRRFETAPLADLKRTIRRPSPEEASALKVWLGPDRYEQLRQDVLKPSKRSGGPLRRKVVVLHGIMGAELSVRSGNNENLVWVNLPRIAMGKIDQLKMGQDGRPETDSYATKLMRKYYLEMLLGLGSDHDVEPFWYDWRLDLNESAARLNQFVTQRFGTSAPVDFVAHSMGGLVVRTWIKNHKTRWDKACRLIMLGTPNHGSFAIPQVITGAHKMVRKLALLDLHHNLAGFTKILNTFPGSCQMLPSPLVMESMEPLYRAATWPGRGVSQVLLDRALKHHRDLAPIIDRERMLYIAGTGHLTAADFRDWSAMDRLDGYVFTPEGDETVPHRLGFLEDEDGSVPVRFSRASHGSLPNDPKVVAAVKQYLEGKPITELPEKQTITREHRGIDAVNKVRNDWDEEIKEFSARVPSTSARGRTRRDAEIEVGQESNLLSGFLNSHEQGQRSRGGANEKKSGTPPRVAKKQPTSRSKGSRIQIALHLEDILTFGSGKPGEFGPVDFITAGHYQGVSPQWAELALDLRLSKALGLVANSATTGNVDPSQLFITEATARGAVTMRLGEPYILPLPNSRLSIALAGLGLPGTLGRAELAVMIHEFVVSLAKLGCRHLGTVVIGSGDDNMDVPTVSRIWLETLHLISSSGLKVIPHITFVLISPRRVRELDGAFKALLENNPALSDSIDYQGPTISPATLNRRIDSEFARNEAKRKREQKEGKSTPPKDVPPTFINVARVSGGFEFSAITNTASVPLRVIKVDPVIIENIGRNLAENGDLVKQREWGALLERLLIPRDLRPKLFASDAPVVFTLDASAARIPWEMLRIPSTLPDPTDRDDLDSMRENHSRQFLGSCKGFGVTRQLRTIFAPAPELPRGTRREMKVLIVADPAEDASLSGALEEAMVVAEIAERLRSELEDSGSDLKVTLETRIGPSEATREEVLRLLTLERFDVLHFAGHCYFDKDDPAESGWIFHAGRNERITAAELSRIDHVPAFVFSNACESGITPDRVNPSSLELPPAFAEAFFQRGVRNLICTAWPVEDTAALIFAQSFYEALLGLTSEFKNEPQTIRDAMLHARCKTIESGEGMATWGAYQHYGNPSFRFTR